MTRQRYLVVSLGSIGRRHLRNLRCLRPNAEIAVLRLNADIDGAVLPEGADLQFGSLDQAIAFSPVAAIVAGPATTHRSVALGLAKAGVHLLLEKPMADRSEGLAQVIEACRAQGVVLMVGYNLRFLPALRFVKDFLDGDGIGRVLAVRAEVGQYLADWRPEADYRQVVSARSDLGGGALLELSHELDYLYWLFGMPDRVTARLGRYSELEIDVEDSAELILEYDSPRRLVSVHLDMVQRVPFRQCRFVGSEATLVWDAIADRVELFQPGVPARILEAPILADRNRMYLEELEHFFACVSGQANPLVDGKAGLDVLLIVEAARRSMSTGATVEVMGDGDA